MKSEDFRRKRKGEKKRDLFFYSKKMIGKRREKSRTLKKIRTKSKSDSTRSSEETPKRRRTAGESNQRIQVLPGLLWSES